MKQLDTNKKGFTIIEVVLVLAIAGLIFLIVFIALPQLQRSRRDTQRKNDVGRVLASLESFAGNNDGEYPAIGDIDDFQERYMTDNFNDPTSGIAYEDIQDFSAFDVDDGPGSIYYQRDGQCDNEAIVAGGGDREVAVIMVLEQGAYCQDNQ